MIRALPGGGFIGPVDEVMDAMGFSAAVSDDIDFGIGVAGAGIEEAIDTLIRARDGLARTNPETGAQRAELDRAIAVLTGISFKSVGRDRLGRRTP